jgi:hypothetical protein
MDTSYLSRPDDTAQIQEVPLGATDMDSGDETISKGKTNWIKEISKAEKESKILKTLMSSSEFDLESFTGARLDRVMQFLQSEEFKLALTFRDQVGIMTSNLRSDESDHEFTFRDIAHIFQIINPESIRVEAYKWKTKLKINGHPSIITSQAHNEILRIVSDRFQPRNPIAVHEIVTYLSNAFKISVSYDTLKRYIRRQEIFNIIKGQPIEANRVHIDENEIRKWDRELIADIIHILQTFIFTVDETGCDEYVDK